MVGLEIVEEEAPTDRLTVMDKPWTPETFGVGLGIAIVSLVCWGSWYALCCSRRETIPKHSHQDFYCMQDHCTHMHSMLPCKIGCCAPKGLCTTSCADNVPDT